MRKLFSFMALALMVVAMTFTSCENGQGTQEEDKPIDAKYLQTVWFGDFYSKGYDVFLVQMATGTVDFTAEGALQGTGDVIVLELYTNAVNFAPKAGTYKVSANGGAGTIAAGQVGSSGSSAGSTIMAVKNGVEGDETFIEDGELVISGTADNMEMKLTVKGIGEGGKDVVYVCKGKVEVYDNTEFSGEPFVATTKSVSFPSASFENWGAWTSNIFQNAPATEQVFAMLADNLNNPTQVAQVMFNVENGTTLPAGTYTINQTLQAGTILASLGYVAGFNAYFPSNYIDVVKNEIFFFISGTATVAENSITINATTAYGSTLNLTYNGAINIVEPQGAPAIKAFRTADKAPRLNFVR